MESPIALTCMISIKWIRNLYLHMIWIHHILPPVVKDSVFVACHFGQMLEPPFVMFPNIAVSPVTCCDGTDFTFKVWEVLQPVITFAGDRTWIVPIIIALAVWCEMDISQGGLARCGFLIADESPPQILDGWQSLECFFQNGFGAVPHIFQHFTDAALIRESHDDKAPPGCVRVFQWRSIAPEGAGSTHDGFVKAGMREVEDPDLVNLVSGNQGQDIETINNGVVIRFLRHIGTIDTAHHIQIGLGIVHVPIHLCRETIYVNALDDLIARQPSAGLQDVGHEASCEIFYSIPMHEL